LINEWMRTVAFFFVSLPKLSLMFRIDVKSFKTSNKRLTEGQSLY